MKVLLVSMSLAALSMTQLWLSLLAGPAFHHTLPSRIDYTSGLVLFVLLSLLIVFLFKLMQSANQSVRRIVGPCLLIVFLLSPLDCLRVNIGAVLSSKISSSQYFKFSPILLLPILFFSPSKSYPKFLICLLLASPFSAFVVCQLLFGIMTGGPRERMGVNCQGPTNPQEVVNRVVWIVFDELDYRLAFLERPRDVFLRNFDHLANESVNFSFALPPAQMTAISIPSLIDGHTYISSYPSSCSNLILRSEDKSLSRWGSRENLFTDMQQGNHLSAAVGWFLPYTRIFSDKLHYSWWEPNSPQRYIGNGDDLLSTMRNHIKAFNPIFKREFHNQTLEACVQNTMQVVASEKYSLCFIHLPIPHLPSTQPWRYNEPQGTVVNYFRNLIVADQVLGEVLSKLKGSSGFNKTTVIVSSDHHWRSSQQYDGKTDLRVPLIIRFPDQNYRVDIDRKFDTVETRYLIKDIIRATNLTDVEYGKKIIKKHLSN